jgi:hypothetical protein
LHARTAAFENRDVSVADELAALVRDRFGADGAIPGAGRHMVLLAPTNGGALALTLFDGEEELQAAAAVLDDLEAGIPEFVRGRRTSVRGWEVALDEIAEECRAARVAALDVAPWRVVELVYLVRDEFATEADELEGWRGGIVLVDRQSGETRTITFWASDDALRRSEVRETQLRIRTAAAVGASVARIDRYAVAVDAVPAVA